MKRYLLFCGDNYYPHGGWADFAGSFDSISDAHGYLLKHNKEWEWFHIVDSSCAKMVAKSDEKA
jgi:hypothetical protein